jgi:hypothetical protein
MEISPGVELVWGLAGRETIAARMKEVTPDHFFCGLLKLTEISDDDLKLLTPAAPVVQQLAEERDRVAAALAERLPSGTAQVRHELRRILGKGSSDPGSEPLHRSDASRQLFDRVGRLAKAGVVEASLLLRALLESPTPAMARVLGSPAGQRPGATAGGVKAALASPYAQDLGQSAVEAPACAKPQVDVMRDALRADRLSSILLVCDSTVRLLPIIASAAGSQGCETQVIGVDLVGLQRDEPDRERLTEAVGRLLGEAPVGQGRAFCLDTTAFESTEGEAVLQNLIPLISSSAQRILLAVRADIFARLIADNPDLDEAFRLIWIHDLSCAEIPVEL